MGVSGLRIERVGAQVASGSSIGWMGAGGEAGETTEDGLFTLEAVTCLAACDKAPMFQTQGPDGIKYHENMTVDRTMELIQVLKKKS